MALKAAQIMALSLGSISGLRRLTAAADTTNAQYSTTTDALAKQADRITVCSFFRHEVAARLPRAHRDRERPRDPEHETPANRIERRVLQRESAPTTPCQEMMSGLAS